MLTDICSHSELIRPRAKARFEDHDVSTRILSKTGWTMPAVDEQATLWGKAAAAYAYPVSTSGNDVMRGTSRAEGFHGKGGNDTIYGYGGVDVIAGGAGNDKLYGGSGKDTFFFDARLNAKTNVDRIMDFKAADDVIALRSSIFKKAGPYGELKETAFRLGKKALDADDRIIYDKATGSIYYDADGTGTAKAIKFAVLNNKATITYQDFFMS
jgi:Ca2+-binding RTX toxin-like protein